MQIRWASDDILPIHAKRNLIIWTQMTLLWIINLQAETQTLPNRAPTNLTSSTKINRRKSMQVYIKFKKIAKPLKTLTMLQTLLPLANSNSNLSRRNLTKLTMFRYRLQQLMEVLDIIWLTMVITKLMQLKITIDISSSKPLSNRCKVSSSSSL